MYVSMLEGRKAYFRNMGRLGLYLLPLEKKDLFRFLEMPTLSAEGLPAIWEEIVRNIDESGIVPAVCCSCTAQSHWVGTRNHTRGVSPTIAWEVRMGAG